MKVEIKEALTFRLGDIKSGTPFWYENVLYMKSDERGSGGCVRVMNLRSGYLIVLDATSMVVVAKAKVVVNEEGDADE